MSLSGNIYCMHKRAFLDSLFGGVDDIDDTPDTDENADSQEATDDTDLIMPVGAGIFGALNSVSQDPGASTKDKLVNALIGGGVGYGLGYGAHKVTKAMRKGLKHRFRGDSRKDRLLNAVFSGVAGYGIGSASRGVGRALSGVLKSTIRRPPVEVAAATAPAAAAAV